MKDLIGLKFGRLTVVSFKGKNKHSHNLWNCICECGEYATARTFHLTSGHSNSCGCYRKDRTKEVNTTHKMCDTRIYSIWTNMVTRATNPNFHQSQDYIERGIDICPEWLLFINFKNDMFESYEAHVNRFGEKETMIDRVDNNKGYRKDNCKWSTRVEQNNNRRNVI